MKIYIFLCFLLVTVSCSDDSKKVEPKMTSPYFSTENALGLKESHFVTLQPEQADPSRLTPTHYQKRFLKECSQRSNLPLLKKELPLIYVADTAFEVCTTDLGKNSDLGIIDIKKMAYQLSTKSIAPISSNLHAFIPLSFVVGIKYIEFPLASYDFRVLFDLEKFQVTGVIPSTDKTSPSFTTRKDLPTTHHDSIYSKFFIELKNSNLLGKETYSEEEIIKIKDILSGLI